MKTRMVLIVLVASVLLLLGLGILLSFFFLQVKPDFSFFMGGQIALIELKGEISNSEALFSTWTTASEIAETIRQADSDPSIRGILLKINSPGGSVVATKQIVSALRESKKPKVAWISDIGASGGYYAAATCDYIVADEDSLTGSLGAISIILNLSGLMEKYGLKAETFKSGQYKDMGSPFKEMSEEERKIMEEIVEQAWQNSKDSVLELRGEKLDRTRLNEIFDGRIMTGKQALDYGLIDATGSKKDAVKKLGEMIGVEKPIVKKYGSKKSLLSYLSRMGYSFGTGFKQSLASEEIRIRS